MEPKCYGVAFEVKGPAAMFTRPDSGAAPVSYPAPTYSAAKGMFEAVARYTSAFIRPTRVEIYKPIKFHKYTTNYGGPLRKANQIAKGSAYQLPATILVDVHYRIYGVVEKITAPPTRNNHLHALQDIFSRRLGKGQFFTPPCLGWKEFVPTYFGPVRPISDEEREARKTINLEIPSMLHTVFEPSTTGMISPQFQHDVRIREGVLEYA